MVGDTGIEPVPPTVSMLSLERWLLSLRLDFPEFLDLRRWLPRLTTVGFGCGVAPMWPEASLAQHLRNGGDDGIHAAAFVTSIRPLPSCRKRWSKPVHGRTIHRLDSSGVTWSGPSIDHGALA